MRSRGNLERPAPTRPFQSRSHRAVPEAGAPPQPPWIVAGEIVETSQLFARTVAGIDPLWIVQLAPHLCQVTHQNPHWSAAAGNVLVEEKTTLYGLEVRKSEGLARQHQSGGSHGNFHPLGARRGGFAALAARARRRTRMTTTTRAFSPTIRPPAALAAAVCVSRTQPQGAPENRDLADARPPPRPRQSGRQAVRVLRAADS